MPYYGSKVRGTDELRDWLLGGDRKRRILEGLADAPENGWTAEDLARDLDCGTATVYETFRALRGAGLLDAAAAPRYRLASHTDLSDALRGLIAVLKIDGTGAVQRPPRTRS